MRQRLFTTPTRRLIPVVIAALLTTGLTITQPFTAAAASAPTGPATPKPPPEAAAMNKARETGQPVEVDGQQTPNTTILANPDGRFTYRASARAERVHKDGQWRTIDTALTPRPDGSYAPVASVADLTFSGGGTTPLITLTKDDKILGLFWPTPLPTAQVSGSSVTYPSVFPGVDLRVTATADTFREILVVHDATAAKNPALTAITLDATTTGLTVDATPDGRLNATDPNGETVFVGSTPVMWDSAHNADQPVPTVDDPGATTPINVTTTPGPTGHTTVTITPDPATLTGNNVVYPVYIDPTTGDIGTTDWGNIADNGYTNYRDTYARVGRCNGWTTPEPCNGNWVARSYFVFPTTALQARNGYKANLQEAWFTATNAHTFNNDCDQVTTAYTDFMYSSSTTWNSLGAEHVLDSHNACPGTAFQVDVYQLGLSIIDNNNSRVTVELRIPDEGVKDDAHWNRFANNAVLTFTYVFPPNVAQNDGISNAVNCTGLATTPDSHPTLYAIGSDNNAPPLNVNLYFQVLTGDRATVITTSPPIQIASGTRGQWTVNTALPDGAYAYSVKAVNTEGAESIRTWSQETYFVVRATPPDQANILTTDYTPHYWAPPGGTFNLWTGDTHVTGFTYTFTGPGTERVPTTTDCNYRQTFPNGGWTPSDANRATITLPSGLSPGYHTLHVRTFDQAHNLSTQETNYTFYITPNLGLPTQQYETENTPITQPTGQNRPTDTQTDPTYWSAGKQILMRATTTGQSFTTTLTVNTEADYTLAAGLTKANDYGQLTFTLDNKPVGNPFDGYNPTITTLNQTLAGIHLTTGTHPFTITVTGTNPASTGAHYYAGLDYLRLTPTQRLEAEDPAQITWTQPTGQNYPTLLQQAPIWSNNTEKLLVANQPNATLDLTFTTPLEADYALGAMLTTGPICGQLSFTLDNTTPLAHTDTTPFDGYNPNQTATYQPLGGAHLTTGQHKITIKVTGTNPNSIYDRYAAGIDYLSLAPLNNITTTSFTDAMNNHGISNDTDTLTTPTTLDLSTSSLSAQTLTKAGLAPGSTITINGATFTTPTPNTKGNDNIIATGQTIPLPANQQVPATGMGMLVVSTCGDTPATTTAVTYTDGTRDQQTLAPITDWTHTPNTVATPVTSLPYRNTTTGRDSSSKATIYAVFIPTNPLKTLQKLTLPNTGTVLRAADRACADTALHVLAVAPRPLSPTDGIWNGAWAAPVDASVAPPAPGFADKTLRVIAHPSIAGANARVRLSNTGSADPLTIDATSIAAQTTGAATTTPTALRFAGNTGITIPAGGEVYSDPVIYPSGGTGSLAVSIHLPTAPAVTPAHTANGTVTYVAAGNTTTNATATPFTTTLNSTYYLTGIDITTTNTNSGTVAILADQNTSSPGNDPTAHPAWGDTFATQLGTGLPGGLTTVTHTTPPPPGWWTTQNQTTLAQPRLRTVIVTLGAQDILNGTDPTTIETSLTALITDINGFNRYRRPDGIRIRVTLATVAPLGLNPNDLREHNRQVLNDDITTNFRQFGANDLINLDQPLQDPAHPTNINPTYLTNGLPNDTYYQHIAQTFNTAITNHQITL